MSRSSRVQLRIIVGYIQVVAQIGLVLSIDFPPAIQAAFDLLKPLSLSFKSMFQLDCLGSIDFYTEWTIRAIVLPLLMVGLVSLWYLYENRQAGAAGSPAAVNNLKANLFVIVFLVYPGVSNEACKPNRNWSPFLLQLCPEPTALVWPCSFHVQLP